jgi:hypothetical protein
VRGSIDRGRSLDAIARDDAFLDALGRGECPEDSDALAVALSEWRGDLEASPLPVAAERRLEVLRRRVGRGVTVAAVASAVGLGSLTGMAAAATHAQPGSALWPIARMVIPERAESRQAAYHARDWMDRAAAAAAEDRRDQAAHYLDQAEQDARRVRGDDGARELRDRAAELRRQLAASDQDKPAPEGTATAAPSAEPTATPSESGTGTTGTPRDGSTTGPRPMFPRPSESPSPSPSERPSSDPSRSPEPDPSPSESKPAPSPDESREPGLLELLLPGMFTPKPTDR